MVDFYFDVSSPWSYLAFRNLMPLAQELDVCINWRPVLVGGIFNTVNQRMYASREDSNSPRNRYMVKDLQDCARQAEISIFFPPKVFPVNSVKAMRGCVWLLQCDATKDCLSSFFEALFAAYFTRQEDISSDAVLASICRHTGIDENVFAANIVQPEIKNVLKANTDEAISRGVFGVPSFFVGNDMYFGNDRLGLLRLAVLKVKEMKEISPKADDVIQPPNRLTS